MALANFTQASSRTIPILSLAVAGTFTRPEPKQKPQWHLRAGGLEIACWKSVVQSEDGSNHDFFSVSAQRAYKDKAGKWQQTQSLGRQDLLPMARLLEQWVGIELWKRLQYLGEGRLFHLLTKDGSEVGFIIERAGTLTPNRGEVERAPHRPGCPPSPDLPWGAPGAG